MVLANDSREAKLSEADLARADLTGTDLTTFCSVQRYFYAWRDDATWRRINHHLVMAAREAEGREASPSAGVIDIESFIPLPIDGSRGA